MLLTPWETATDVTPAVKNGLLPRRAATPLTLFCSLAIAIALWPVFGFCTVPIALVFGRLVALDLTTYTLPNIYTVPLLIIGLLHAFTHGWLMQAILALLLIYCLSLTLTRSNLKMGMGGGDLKLLAALFAFLPLTSAFWAVAVGCLLYSPVTFAKPRSMVPFGVPLIVGWVILLCYPHLPNWLISTIS